MKKFKDRIGESINQIEVAPELSVDENADDPELAGQDVNSLDKINALRHKVAASHIQIDIGQRQRFLAVASCVLDAEIFNFESSHQTSFQTTDEKRRRACVCTSHWRLSPEWCGPGLTAAPHRRDALSGRA